MRRTWEASSRTDVTFSLADPARSARAALRVREELDGAGYGYTIREAVGAWRGLCERSFTVSLVDSAGWKIAVAAAHAAGCHAVQIEHWGTYAGQCGYTCEEWVPEGDENGPRKGTT